MSAQQIDLKEVPGVDIIKERLVSIDPGLSVSAAGYDFDRTLYVLELSGQGREGRVRFSRNFLMTCAITGLLREAGIPRNCTQS